MTDPVLLTPREAANALGIGRSKLYELLQTGVLESVHIGACRRIPTEALSELVARLRAEEDVTASDQRRSHRLAHDPTYGEMMALPDDLHRQPLKGPEGRMSREPITKETNGRYVVVVDVAAPGRSAGSCAAGSGRIRRLAPG